MIRHGDYEVEVSLPEIERWRDRTPILVDDIISTGSTMVAAVRHLARLEMRPPVCVDVHAVFSTGSYQALHAAGPGRIVTTNTIAHETNAVDVVPLIAAALEKVY